MARDSFNEQKNKNVYSTKKKKKKQTTKTVVKKPQSSSVSKETKQEQRITQKTYGQPTKPAYKNNKAKTAQKQQTVENNTRPTQTTQRQSRPAVANTSRDMMSQRQKSRAGVETALQQKRDPLGINNKQTVQERYNKNNVQTAKQRKDEEEKRTAVTSRNASEWNAVKNKSKEDQQAWFTKKATEAQERHAAENNRKVDKGTDNLATSAVKAAYHSGKGAVHSLAGALERSSMNDFYEGAKLKYDAMRKGMSEEEAEKYGNEKAKKRQEARLAGFRQKTKIEQEKTEAIKNQEASKDSGPIPLRKWAVGAASFTGQRLVDSATGPYSLLTMGARVLEDERNSGKEKNDQLKKRLADSGQFTQEELDEEFDKIDKRTVANAYASSGLEMMSELMFGGIGLSKKYLPEGASGLLDRVANKLTGRLGSTALGRVALGIGEETAEEWIANPVQAAVSNRLTGNRLQSLQEESIRRAYQGQARDLKEIQATAADINSDAFLERAKSIYKESGASDEEAAQIAELARDYFNADITGDSKTAEEKLNQITDILAGGENDMREKWTLNDALEVAGEMILSVGAEAAPGAISTAQTGSQYKANYGIDGVRKLAKVVENLDEEKSERAKAIIDDIDSGKDISNTQVAMLMEWSNNAALKAQDREITRDQLVQRKMRDEKLFVPIVDTEYNLAPATEERFEAITERVADLAQEEMGFDMSDVDAYAIGDVVAAYETGTISAEQMNELNIENPENRAVFEKATGIDLGQYTVKDSRGNIKVAASNTAMQQALFAKATDNYIESARIEQENWNDVERGRAFEELTSNMDGMGGVGIQRVLESVDPRNRGDFLLAGSVARRVYEHARNTNDEWDSVKKDFTDAFGADMNESMKYVFDMAKQAKAIAETKYYGKAVNKNSLNTEDVAVAEGKFTNESARELKGTEIGVLTSVANELGINVIMTDSLDRNENGRYMPSQRTIMLNSANTMGDNLQAIFSHEVTHHLAVYAPDEYIKLSRLVMDRWYKSDADTYNAEIKRIQKLYKDAKGQDLTPEEALEELIADASHDFWSDEEFVNKVATEEPTLAKSIINAIKDFLRKLRNMLSSGNITDEETREGLFAEIGAWDETYRLYMDAYNAARKDQAQQAVDEWQARANRYSVGYHAGDLGKSTVDDYAHQGGSRGSGHFGFGTYFVGDEEQINYGNYGKRKHEAVDFDKYNLFKPRNFDQGLKLHDALRTIDGIITDYSDFMKYKDSILNEDLWNDELYRTSTVNNDIERLVDEYEMDGEPDSKRKERIDKFISEMPEYYRENIEREAQKKYDEAQNREVDEDNIREYLTQRYELWGSARYDNVDDYVNNNLESEIRYINNEKEVPYEQWYYETAKDAINEYSEDWASEKRTLTRLADDLQRALNYEQTSSKIERALLKTEEIVKGYQPEGGYRLDAEPGLDSGATVFMKQLGYEGVDVRHIPEMDNTGYGSVIYDLKDEDLARKQEIGTARFSISEPVERVADLIAVHNLNEEDLVGNLGLGGFPMPSIAITKDSMGHDKYGDISLLFNSSTIDPSAKSANQVFGGDAYTPTFPTVHYKANSKVSKKLVDMYYKKSDELGYDVMRPMYEYAVTIDDTLDRAGGEKAVIERAKKDIALKRLFLRLNDKDVEDVTKTTTTSLSDAEVARNDFWINELGKEAIQEARPSDLRGRDAMHHFAEWRDERIEDLKKSYEKLCREVYGFDDDAIQTAMADEKAVKKEISSNIVAASNYLKNGRDTVKTEIDYDATWKLIDEAAKANDYDAWVDDLFKGIEEKSGIRNDKDLYTPAGNRRSWESLHEPVTLDNVVKQMKKELDSGGGTFLGNNPVGAAQKKYKSLDEIRADEDRLQYLDDENYGKLREVATAKLSKVSHEIYENSPKRQNSFAMFGAIDVGSDIAEALNKTRNKDKLKGILERDYSYNVSDQNMDDLMDALHDLANLPTGYFEAKPKRAVWFDEVKAAIVPKEFPDHLKAQLSNYGTSIYEYDPEVEGDRTQKINDAASENDLRFSISANLDEPYMDAVNSGNMDEAQRLVDEAAKMAGYTTKAYHGTGANFTVFDKDKSGKNYRGHSKYGKGLYFADSIDQANRWGKNRNVLKTYLDLKNPYVVPLVAEEGDILLEEYNKYKTAQNARLKPSKEEPGAFLFEMLNEMTNDKGYTTKFLQGLGYDGVIAEHGAMADMPAWTEYVAFDAEQIKSADPVTYAEDGSVIPLSERFDPDNNDIRYSLPTQDSDGNILTDGQMEYFKNSQARDEQGRLVPVYHTTNMGGFTIFDPSYSEDRRSIFFTDSLAISKTYGTEDSSSTYECYLNLENPLIVDADYNAWDRIPMTRQVGNISLTEDYDTNEVSSIAFEEGHDGVIIKNCRDWAVDDSSDFDTTENSPYSTIYIAFSSEQVKDINNENPTENPDIRYSIATRDEVSGYLMQNAESITDIPLQNALLEDNRIRYSIDATDFENSIVSEWGRRKRNLAEDVKDTPLRRSLIRLMKQVRTDSGEDKQYSTETIDETIRSLKKMYYYAKGDKAKDFAREAWDAAERIVGDINYNDVQYLHYKGISSYFADTEIHVPEELIDDDTFIQFAKNNAGRIRLFADEGIEIEEAWKSLHDAYPGLFPRAAFVADSPVGMLVQMDWVLNQLEPYKEAYTSEEHSKLVEDIANTLCSIVEEGNEYNATVNDLNVRAMRQRHSEALRKVQEQEKQKRDNQKERAEKWKQKYLERVEKNKADKEAGKQKKNETKLVGDIEKNIKWLSDRLRPETRTKDNAIPEQFRSALGALLAEFDLQSKGSKKIEKKKGYPSKTTLKLQQLRDQYAAIAKENDDDGNNVFRYNGDLLVKMDELIKTMESLDKFFDKRYGREVTIADLSLSEMFIIDTMLKSLVHEFREYKNVTIDSKRAEIADVSSEVIGDMDTQIGRHGAAREGGALGKINGLLNMAEVTPIYFFKRLGAMYKMYRELRKGFDKYIENDREVIKRLSEIMSGYYNKKNPGTTIESWRTTEDAQTFNFEHGPVTLSVAQMMEVYLYANRPQAFGHMIGDGIIVTPISPVGKIETAKEKLLGHEPMVDPVRLTYENVQEIISKLSEEQVNMANKLQELVAGYMSDLGNETTMKLYGYKMFDDPNYFGIHVSQTATNSSVDAPAITETIKNFGWTKPLTPGAKNTIVIGDIFTDVARYCNEMNQFNAYAVPVSDFMRVYNYTLRDENGELQGSAKSAIIKAFGKQAHTYIMNFLRDLNGSSMRRNGGLEGMIDAALGRAKKAAVFMNMRVALQQPTAIVRALAQVNARYFVGVRPSAAATKEMIEHCPIAQWKAWGFYDTHFGRDVEDLIMNNWSKADVVGSWIYGALDNMTWGMIWQAVKNEVDADIKKRGLDIKKGSQEYWDMCNDRASEVFDSTQVVDSPFHRSDAMRSKDTLVKQFTSFQAEPTLSFNVIRDFAVQAYDAVADGDKTKAAKLIAKGVEVWTLQAAVVAVAQSLWDAVRHKDPDGDDDEDEGFLQLWWQNFMADFVDDLKFYNNIYFLKEFTPYAEKLVDYMKTGKWDTYDSNKLLMFQGAEKMTQGLQQLIKKIQKGDEYKHKNGEPYTWYEVMTNFLGGVGYLTGMPIGTVMRDAQSILKWFHINAFAADGSEKTDKRLADAIAEKMGYQKAGSSSDNVASEATSKESKSDKDESADAQADIEQKVADYRESLSDNFTDEEKDELVKQYEKRIKKGVKSEEVADRDKDTMLFDAEKAAAGYEGTERDKRIWQSVSQGYKSHVESGDYAYIARMRSVVEQAGGNLDYFDEQIVKASKTALKKTIEPGGADTESEMVAQQNIRYYLQGHGVTQEEISSEIVYKCAAAKDLKVAFRINDEQAIIESSYSLMFAGLTTTDYEKIYTNRNRMDLSKYDGKYKDRLKSTGTFVWPTQGTITSHFGARNAPTRGASSNHPAIDIGAPKGTPVVAADGGVVIYAGTNGGYGNSVGIKHDNGMVTYYNHLSAWNVNVGDTVGQGQQIANVGSTGISTGPHLDFKILDTNGKPVDPEMYLNKRS